MYNIEDMFLWLLNVQLLIFHNLQQLFQDSSSYGPT
jgi:hypothetical protein